MPHNSSVLTGDNVVHGRLSAGLGLEPGFDILLEALVGDIVPSPLGDLMQGQR